MKRHLNTLFVTTQGAYVGHEGESVTVKVDHQVTLRAPIHTLGGIVCFGHVGVSPSLMGKCGEQGVTISFLTHHGRYLASVRGFTPGNVLLRREQYRRADSLDGALAIAIPIVTAKLANSRAVIQRATRDYPDALGRPALLAAASELARSARAAVEARSLDELRGIEGDGANTYFGVFNHLLTTQQADFAFTVRTRRPPLDRINALLSFVYALLAHDARAACETSGLDAAVGFLHRDRPGRPGLALDLMEEFRAFLGDRLAVSLVNRRQVGAAGFEAREGGAVLMDDQTRKLVLVAYQQRKQETLTHPFLGEETTVGLLMHLQARLLARHLRGDLDAYPPFLWK